jgi:hypothetical protein
MDADSLIWRKNGLSVLRRVLPWWDYRKRK